MTPNVRTSGGATNDRVDVPVLLARWRSGELAYASTFDECAGTSFDEIEDLYDMTATRLLEQVSDFDCEEHLRRALRRGIRLRALRLHRDHRVRTHVLAQAAPGMVAQSQLRASREEPEQVLLAREDDLIIGEFLAELTQLERRVFALVADGRSWRAIATALELPENEARNTTRACERKREQFTTLYTTGRLCGYRSHTIGSLLSGRDRGELAVAQAFAHLRHCRTCQVHHKTDTAGLRAAFDARVLAVLPLPLVVVSRSSLLDSLQAGVLRVPRFFQRGAAPQAGVRKRALEIVAGTSASAKLAGGIAGIVLLAGGTIGTVSTAHRSPHPSHHLQPQHGEVVFQSRAMRFLAPVRRTAPFKPSRTHRLPRPTQQHTPGGFSYLGDPSPSRLHPTTAPAVTQHGGGPFRP